MINKKTFLLLFAIILLVSSCSLTELTVNKRLYNKGFYVNFKNNEENNVVEIIRKIDTDSVKNKLEIQVNTSELIASNFVNESQNAVQNDFENIILPVKITKLEPSKSLNKKIIFTKSKTKIEPEEKKIKRTALFSFFSGLLSSFLILTILFPIISLSFFFISWGLSIVLIIFAIFFALSTFKKSKNLPKTSKWKWFAIFGLILAIIGCVIWCFYSIIGLLALFFI